MSEERFQAGYTLKILGALMTYPSAELQAHADAMVEVLRAESWLPAKILRRIEILADAIELRDLLDAQADYVALFDRTPSLSLHLFEHVHGDSRDRGQALVELDMLYREIGLHNVSEHTPDYLPLFLEYLSLLPLEQARDNLDGAIDVIAALGERLKTRESPYASLFEALEAAASRKPDARKLAAAMAAQNGMPLNAEEMDAAWEEQFAFENPGADTGQGGCPKAQDMLARMQEGLSEREASK